MPVFNRFFLLFGLVFSFIVPLIDIEYANPFNVSPAAPLTILPSLPLVEQELLIDQFDWVQICYLIYGLITSFLFLRIAYHLNNLTTTIRKNQTTTYQTAQLVLIENQPLPYTFLNYIFVDASAHQNGLIEQELYTHELAHAQQFHSIDILVVEFLQALFWFNPLLFFYKRSIQLNHEFLADQKVIQTHQKITAYQHLLLDKITANQQISLTSNLNFLLTKKRLKMMTKNTSQLRGCILATVNLLLFCCFLFMFSNPVIAQKRDANQLTPKQKKKLKDAYFKDATFSYEATPNNHKSYASLPDKIKNKLSVPLDQHTLPLPKGTVIYLDKKNSIKSFSNASIPPPPPPPAPPLPAPKPAPAPEPVPEPIYTPMPEPRVEPLPTPKTAPKVISVEINGKIHLHVKNADGTSSYYTTSGEQVDKDGKPIKTTPKVPKSH